MHCRPILDSLINPLLLLALLAVSATANAASFTPLGDLPGGDVRSFAQDISADGSTVVGSSSSASGNEAFVWTAATGIQGLGDLPGGNFSSRAIAISPDGSRIVGTGSSGLADGPSFARSEAFVWDTTNGMQGIGDLPGGTFNSGARGVSGNGTTVVGFGSSANGGGEAFSWNDATGFQGLGDLPGSVFGSSARNISADGSTIVGQSFSALGPEAFVWDATNGMQGIGDLPGGLFAGGQFNSIANAVSADGSVVIGNGQSSLGTEGFIWDATNGMRGLGDIAGGGFGSFANDVSADGTVVVGSGFSIFGMKATIWDATNGMRSLPFLLSTLGIDLTGWDLTSARAVSDDGLTIVGVGTNPAGFQEAFIAVIPEPGTALLMALGLVGLGATGKRKLPTRVIRR